jgi:hypothetical protein
MPIQSLSINSANTSQKKLPTEKFIDYCFYYFKSNNFWIDVIKKIYWAKVSVILSSNIWNLIIK